MVQSQVACLSHDQLHTYYYYKILLQGMLYSIEHDSQTKYVCVIVYGPHMLLHCMPVPGTGTYTVFD